MSKPVQNGTITAHNREWPVYERMTTRDGKRVMELFMLREDQAEKFALDEAAMEQQRCP